MTGFEPRTSGIGSNRSTNWATTTALHQIVVSSVDLWHKGRGFDSILYLYGGQESPKNNLNFDEGKNVADKTDWKDCERQTMQAFQIVLGEFQIRLISA